MVWFGNDLLRWQLAYKINFFQYKVTSTTTHKEKLYLKITIIITKKFNTSFFRLDIKKTDYNFTIPKIILTNHKANIVVNKKKPVWGELIYPNSYKLLEICSIIKLIILIARLNDDGGGTFFVKFKQAARHLKIVINGWTWVLTLDTALEGLDMVIVLTPSYCTILNHFGLHIQFKT